jgi:hypothetical protein
MAVVVDMSMPMFHAVGCALYQQLKEESGKEINAGMLRKVPERLWQQVQTCDAKERRSCEGKQNMQPALIWYTDDQWEQAAGKRDQEKQKVRQQMHNERGCNLGL